MDNFRRQTPAKSPQRPVDGFFAKPSSGARRPATSSDTNSTGMRFSGRRSVEGFNRTEGFHSSNRRTLIKPSPAGGALPQAAPSRHAPKIEVPAPSKRRRNKKQLSRFQIIRKWTSRSLALGMLMALIGGGYLFSQGYLQLNKVFQGGSSAAALADDVDPSLLKGEGDGRVNILMLGVGGSEHSGGDLTDTLMVASIDPVNNQAVLLSIPRDLWTKMPNNYIAAYHKINAAYESGKYKHSGKQVQNNDDRKAVMAGFQGVDGVVERVTGIPIHYNVLVDFDAFGQAVDSLGGITVNSKERLYDPTMAWENKRNPVLAIAGDNNFNGKQALNYVRSRSTSSDFARGERQRTVILAMKEKATEAGTLTNPVKISNLMSAFGDNVQSDISLSDMTRLASILKRIPSSQIQSVSLADPGNNFVTTGNINGLSVVIPKAGIEDYADIQTYIRSKLRDGFITKENATIAILNGTSTPGLASDKADELKAYGYNIGLVDNAPTQDYAKTTVVDLSNGSKKYTLNYLKKRLQIPNAVTQLPAGVIAENTNIVIILGTNEANPSQN